MFIDEFCECTFGSIDSLKIASIPLCVFAVVLVRMQEKSGGSAIKLSIYDNEVMLLTRHSRFYAHGTCGCARRNRSSKLTHCISKQSNAPPSFSPRKFCCRLLAMPNFFLIRTNRFDGEMKRCNRLNNRISLAAAQSQKHFFR